MSRPGKNILWILVALLVAYAGYRTYAAIRERAAASKMTKEATGPLKVGVRRVARGTLTETVTVTGEVQPVASVDLVPKISGVLEKLRQPDGARIDEGVAVTAGQVVAVIEHSAVDATVLAVRAALLRAEVQARDEVVAATIAEAKAAVAAAKAQLAEAGANVRQAERDKDRMLKLCAQGSCTEQMRDQAITAWEAAVEREKALAAQVQRAEAVATLVETQTKDLADAVVAQADAALKQALVTLNDAAVKSPINGVVTRRYVDEGDMVGPSGPILRIDDVDTVKIAGGISERHLAALSAGVTPVQVLVDAWPGEAFDGVVHLVGAEIDRATRTVKVEVRIANPAHKLKPGMFARLQVLVGRRENVVVVPNSAVVYVEAQTYAWVAEPGPSDPRSASGSTGIVRARRRSLKLGLAEGARQEVLEGLKAGELLIVRGQGLLREDDPVAPVEASAAPGVAEGGGRP